MGAIFTVASCMHEQRLCVSSVWWHFKHSEKVFRVFVFQMIQEKNYALSGSLQIKFNQLSNYDCDYFRGWSQDFRNTSVLPGSIFLIILILLICQLFRYIFCMFYGLNVESLHYFFIFIRLKIVNFTYVEFKTTEITQLNFQHMLLFKCRK